MIRLMLVGLIATTLLSGCVQQNAYKNSGKPATISQFNTDEAAKTRIALGLQYLKVGQMSNAKFNLEKALGFAPHLAEVHTAFAYYYQQVDEHSLAEQAYKKALSLDPNNPDTLNNYGVFLCRVKQYDKAEQTFLSAINVPSYLKVAESYENAALCAMENQHFERAKRFFVQSLDHSALRANTLTNIAGLSYAMGDYLAAQRYAQRLSNIGVVSPRVLLLRYLIESKLGNIAQAKKYGATLVSMYVKSPEALAYLAEKLDNVEFELLRQQYLRHQYEQLQQNSDNPQVAQNDQPKVIKKLKSQPVDSQAQISQAQISQAQITVQSNPSAYKDHRDLTSTAGGSVGNSAGLSNARQVNPPPAADRPPVTRRPNSEHKPANPAMVSLLNTPQNVDNLAAMASAAHATELAQMPVTQNQQTAQVGVVDNKPLPEASWAVPAQNDSQTGDYDGTMISLLAAEPTPSTSSGAPLALAQQIEPQQLSPALSRFGITDQNTGQSNSNDQGQTVLVDEKEIQAAVIAPQASAVANVEVTNEIASIAAEKPTTTPVSGNKVTIPFHMVEKNQYLYDISIKYNIKLKRLMQWNGLTHSSVLRIGQKILLRDPLVYHVVASGDTLFGISKKYNILLKSLLRWNGLIADSPLILGSQVLIVDPKLYAL